MIDLGRAEIPLVDLDVVKPYFRCRLLKDTLADRGVQLIAPEGDRFWADLPIILPEIKGAIQDPSRLVCLDSGGDDTGAGLERVGEQVMALGLGANAVMFGVVDRLLQSPRSTPARRRA